MALDTAAKRASALQVVKPWTIVHPPPDATIAAADRQHLARMYSGIAAASGDITLFGDRRTGNSDYRLMD